MTSHLPTIEYLSTNYPVSADELREQMRKYKSITTAPESFKSSRTQKKYQSQIGTREFMQTLRWWPGRS